MGSSATLLHGLLPPRDSSGAFRFSTELSATIVSCLPIIGVEVQHQHQQGIRPAPQQLLWALCTPLGQHGAVLTAMNIADERFREQDASENLRRQIKELLEESAQLKNELSEAKREIFKLQQKK